MLNYSSITLTLSALYAAMLSLQGCSSGSSDGGSFGIPWQKDVYKGVDEFAGFCLNPDASRGERLGRQERQGSILHENHFIRELMNDIYLWREDITDVNPNTFAHPTNAFGSLLTTEKTASGKPKDQFSGILRYSDFINRFVDGVEVGIGANISTTHFREADDNKPLELTIAYIEDDSPAAQAGLKRGDKIIEVNGQKTSAALTFSQKQNLFFAVVAPRNTSPISLTIEKINAQEAGDDGVINVMLSPAEVTINPVIKSDIIDQGIDKSGYLVFNTFTSDLVIPQLQEAFKSFRTAGVNELILDLRYNGGGSIQNAQRLAYMIAGEDNTNNKTFSRPRWNDRHPNFDPVLGTLLVDEVFISTEPDNTTPLASLDLNRVIVLTSNGTCSSSERVINALKGIDIDVVQIGDTTCGKPYGSYVIINCEFAYIPLQSQDFNAKGFGDYADGFSVAEGVTPTNTLLPGCKASDDLTQPLGSTQEALLATALYYQANNQCPEPLAKVTKGTFNKANNFATNDINNNTNNKASKPQFYQKPWQTMAIKEVQP